MQKICEAQRGIFFHPLLELFDNNKVLIMQGNGNATKIYLSCR